MPPARRLQLRPRTRPRAASLLREASSSRLNPSRHTQLKWRTGRSNQPSRPDRGPPRRRHARSWYEMPRLRKRMSFGHRSKRSSAQTQTHPLRQASNQTSQNPRVHFARVDPAAQISSELRSVEPRHAGTCLVGDDARREQRAHGLCDPHGFAARAALAPQDCQASTLLVAIKLSAKLHAYGEARH
jgi:hypothetical protein